MMQNMQQMMQNMQSMQQNMQGGGQMGEMGAIFEQFMQWMGGKGKKGSGKSSAAPAAAADAGKGASSKGKGAMKIASGDKVYSGKLRTWSPEKKFGFVLCEELFRQFSQEVYIHQCVLELSKGTVGDTVAFFLHISKTNGNPQASAPSVRLACPDGFALKGTFRPSGEADGHGYLHCPVIYEFFGQDVLVKPDLAGMMWEGCSVAFNAHVNEHRSPVMDQNCEMVDDAWEPTPGDLSHGRNDQLLELHKNEMLRDYNQRKQQQGVDGRAQGGSSGGSKNEMMGMMMDMMGQLMAKMDAKKSGQVQQSQPMLEYGSDGGCGGGGMGGNHGAGCGMGEQAGFSNGDGVWNADGGFGAGCGKGGSDGGFGADGGEAWAGDGGFGGEGGWGKGGKGGGLGSCNGKGGGMLGPGMDEAFCGKGAKGGACKARARMPLDRKIYVGKLRNWEMGRKCGFILCEELIQIHNQEVYIHESVLKAALAQPGDTIAFHVHISHSGQPQASSPAIRIASSDGFALKGYFRPSNEPAGHGYLHCPALHQFIGKDVFVNKEVASLMWAGACVSFNCHLRSADRLPIMDNNAEMVNEEWEPTPGDLTHTKTDQIVELEKQEMAKRFAAGGGSSVADGGCKGMMDMMMQMMSSMPQMKQSGMGGQMQQMMDMMGNGSNGASGQASGGASMEDSSVTLQPTGETFLGVVKSLEANHSGCIACDEFAAKFGGLDCPFSAAAQTTPLAFGEIVEFEVGMDAQGQPQAVAIRSVEQAAQATKRPRFV